MGGRADGLPRGKPPASSGGSQLCLRNSPAGRVTRRLRRGPGLAILGFSRQFRCPKVSKGRAESPQCARRRILLPRMGNEAPTTTREQGLQPYGAFTLFFRWPEGVQGASGKPPACIGMCQPCRKKFPAKGIDAPTTARVMGLPPPTGDSTFFRRERKYQRKPAARRLREKGSYCPF